MGYKFQFVTLAGFHSLNHAMFELSAGYAKRGMAAYSELQQLEFASESKGYTCSKHQREVCLLCACAGVLCSFVSVSNQLQEAVALGLVHASHARPLLQTLGDSCASAQNVLVHVS